MKYACEDPHEDEFKQRCGEVRSILAQQDVAVLKAEALFHSVHARALAADLIAAAYATEEVAP